MPRRRRRPLPSSLPAPSPSPSTTCATRPSEEVSAAPESEPQSQDCVACKHMRRKCEPDCVFAPYFGPEDEERFAVMDRGIGASNVAKMLGRIDPQERAHAIDMFVAAAIQGMPAERPPWTVSLEEQQLAAFLVERPQNRPPRTLIMLEQARHENQQMAEAANSNVLSGRQNQHSSTVCAMSSSSAAPETEPQSQDCAACRQMRRKCVPDCVFVPFFGPEDGERFYAVDRIFGAHYVSDMLEDLAPHERWNAVEMLVHQATLGMRNQQMAEVQQPQRADGRVYGNQQTVPQVAGSQNSAAVDQDQLRMKMMAQVRRNAAAARKAFFPQLAQLQQMRVAAEVAEVAMNPDMMMWQATAAPTQQMYQSEAQQLPASTLGGATQRDMMMQQATAAAAVQNYPYSVQQYPEMGLEQQHQQNQQMAQAANLATAAEAAMDQEMLEYLMMPAPSPAAAAATEQSNYQLGHQQLPEPEKEHALELPAADEFGWDEDLMTRQFTEAVATAGVTTDEYLMMTTTMVELQDVAGGQQNGHDHTELYANMGQGHQLGQQLPDPETEHALEVPAADEFRWDEDLMTRQMVEAAATAGVTADEYLMMTATMVELQDVAGGQQNGHDHAEQYANMGHGHQLGQQLPDPESTEQALELPAADEFGWDEDLMTRQMAEAAATAGVTADEYLMMTTTTLELMDVPGGQQYGHDHAERYANMGRGNTDLQRNGGGAEVQSPDVAAYFTNDDM